MTSAQARSRLATRLVYFLVSGQRIRLCLDVVVDRPSPLAGFSPRCGDENPGARSLASV
jgi:hypothetical protein